jgi:uncharacterized protein (TIGR03435 family)
VKTVVGVLASIAVVFAQTPARPQFDAASIKPNPSPLLRKVVLPPTGGHLNTRTASLRLLIGTAYNVQTFQIVGGPDWIKTIGYDLDAKAGGNPSRSEVWLMLQSLLEERFALQVHRETRLLPVYALTAAKGGIKLPKAQDGDCGEFTCGELMLGADARCCLFAKGRQIAVPEFTSKLSGILGRTAGPESPLRPSIMDVLDQELGVKLTSSKGPVEVLVIDHAERPTAN